MNAALPPTPPSERDVKDGTHFGYHPAPTAFEEIGPQGPSRVALYRKAREVQELAKRAAEFATPGPMLDLTRSQRALDRVQHLLGGGE